MDELTCAKCGIVIEYAGTGRKPKFCNDHRDKPKGADNIKPKSRYRSTGSKSLDVLRMELTQTLQGAGAMLMAVDRYDGLVVIQGTSKLVDALISMAEINPDFKRWLESGTKSVVWIQLGTAIAAIAVPIAAHHRLLPLNERGAYSLFHGELPDGIINDAPTQTAPQQPQAQEPVITEPTDVPETVDGIA
jgi:hypothetical protein